MHNDSLLAPAVGHDDLAGESLVSDRDRGHPLAVGSTLNRLQLGIPERVPRAGTSGSSLPPERLDELFVELHLDSYAEAQDEIVLSEDATDDPLHGRQDGPSSTTTKAVISIC